MSDKESGKAEVLALIPARGGSKGVPRKNIMVIAGRPLIAYTAEQAQQSNLITRVVVSTDDVEIAAVAEACGAEIPFIRPAEYAQDLSPDIDVFHHALQYLQTQENYVPDLVVHLRPTGPIRNVSLIDEAIALMLTHPEADSLRSVAWPLQSPYKMWRINDGYLLPLLTVSSMKDAHSMPRQSLPEVYWQNGYVDVIRPHTILSLHSMAGQKILPFIVQEPIYEIDYADSILTVEQALLKLASGEQLPVDDSLYHPI